MRFLCATLLACVSFSGVAVTAQEDAMPYRLALPGYQYSFPRDHFNHPEYRTEWWYYTGNLQSADGRRFGFELTFFRQGLDRDPARHNAWDARDLYFAHLALSDLNAGRFYHTERTNRSGPGLAGADEATGRIWNGNWQIRWKDADQELHAISEQFELRFELHSEKPPVIQGENGVSQKAEGAGHASHYISLTRLATKGSIILDGTSFAVSGLSWMDHEFFTEQLTANQSGWDWISIQLDDRTELMLFDIRRNDGTIDPFSAGTYIDAQGKSTHLRKEDFLFNPLGDVWKSPATGAEYPVRWKISIPKLALTLEATTSLRSQELAGGSEFAPTYWEGAIGLVGTRAASEISGRGYLEMTGYAHPLHSGR
jgi:predicted secreted hydrolase